LLVRLLALMLKNAARMLLATALPMSVLPVPGGPKSRMPLGGARGPCRETARHVVVGVWKAVCRVLMVCQVCRLVLYMPVSACAALSHVVLQASVGVHHSRACTKIQQLLHSHYTTLHSTNPAVSIPQPTVKICGVPHHDPLINIRTIHSIHQATNTTRLAVSFCGLSIGHIAIS
jgi:hypothetical protein